ncbi:MAG: glucosaminidase domain-containing protein [Clostridium sp.]|uniref:glucosaminidase domain-containing protein n=1 Tax=Clostridium sp. TaxID=1506 RepID=UPI003F3D4E86
MKKSTIAKMLLGLSVSLVFISAKIDDSEKLKCELIQTDTNEYDTYLKNTEYYKANEKLTYIVHNYKILKQQEEIKEQKRKEAERKKKLEQEKQRKIQEENKRVIYNPNNLLEKSNLTREKAHMILKGTRLQTLSNAYVYMEEKYGVNAIFLMSISAEESGWGTSPLARTHNNIGGIKGNNGYRYFNNWAECLDYKARLLKKEYLTSSGSYYNGQSIYSVNIKYCEQKTWSGNINSIANGLVNKSNK